MEKGKIMIVDDERESREALKLNLMEDHYNIIEAENGLDAVQKLESGDNLVNLGLILCDINMPKVNGLECMHYMRENAPGIPIIAITGHPDTGMATDLIAHGIKDYLIKPVEKETLRTTVKKWVTAGKEFDY